MTHRGVPWASMLMVAGPTAWVAVANLGPLVEMARISLLDVYPAAPGETPAYGLGNYAAFLGSPMYRGAFLRSLAFAAACTAGSLITAYPLAYFIALIVPPRRRFAALLALVAPFWTSEIVRIFAVAQLLGARGPINAVLLWTSLADTPATLLYTPFSVGFAMTYAALLSMLLPIYAALDRVPRSLLDAATDLGAGSWRRLWRVTLPLTRSGAVSGCVLVFLLSTGAFAVPTLLGGPDTTLFSMTIQSFFGSAANRWPLGAAFSLILLGAALAVGSALAPWARPRA